jgi:hypothetical protein
VVSDNTTVPVVITDARAGAFHRNLDSPAPKPALRAEEC